MNLKFLAHCSDQGCGSSQIFNASASSSSWSFMLSSLLPLPHLWNFLLLLPATDRISRFRFKSLSWKCCSLLKNSTASTASASTSLLSMKQLIVFSVKKSRQVYFVSYFIWLVLSTGHGMEDDFTVFRTDDFLPFHFHSILKMFHSIFHSLLKFSSLFHSIPKKF